MPLEDRQKQVLVSSFVNIHEQLAEMEASLVEGANPSIFSRYYNDLSQAEIDTIREHFARLRTTMQDWLQQRGIATEIRQSGLRWFVQCGVNFVNVSVAEMGPGKLVGYGELDDQAREEVVKLQAELTNALNHVSDLLREKAATI